MKYLHLSSIRSIFNNVIKPNYRQSVLCAATTLMLLCFGVGEMWGYTILRNGCLVGQADETWSNSDAMTQVGSTNVYYKTYNSPTATTDLKFRIGTGTDWNTEKNADGIDNLNSNIVMVSNGDGDNNIKFQVPVSVPVTIYYNSSTKKIWIKVDSYKTDVLNGKEMFYYGFTNNWGQEFAHFYEAGTRKFGNYAANSYADGSAKLAIGVYDVNGSTNYSASNNDSWAGEAHTGMAAGCQIQTYNDGSNKCYYNAASTFSFGTTAYTIVAGTTIASFPSISFTSKTSGVGSSLSLEGYYYSTSASGPTWTAFTPGTTESSLAAGTYYIKALATDGAIYMASTNYITLTVNNAPVLGVANATSITSSSATFNATATLNSNTTSSYGFKYGAGASYDTKAELISGGTTASTTGALDGTTFSKEVTGLSASTTYYYISYAVVNGTTYYSDAVKSFTTSAAATYNLSVVAGTGISAVTGSTNNISASQNIAITATVATGYTWNTWTKTGTGTLSTFTAGTKNQTVTVGTVGNMTLTASATENMSTLTTSNSYDVGNPSYVVPTKSVSSIGIATTATLTAAAAGTGYTFAGWKLSSNLVVTSGNKDTDLSITVRTNGDGAAATAQAKYTEDLTSTWKIAGGTGLTGNNFATQYNMVKKTGHSTENVAYYTFNVSATNTGSSQAEAYGFKLINSSEWYGLPADGDSYWVSATMAEGVALTTSGKNIQLRADVAGDYEIKVDYTTPASPKVSVTFPTSYTVNFGVSPAGAADAPTNDKSLSNGGLVLSGTSVTFTKDATPNPGYTWSHWDVGGSNVGTENTYRATINAATTVTAVYTENSYSTNVAVSPAGKGSITSPTPAEGKINVSHHTGTSVTATPNTNYVFESWSVTGGGLAVKDGSSLTSNPATFKATSAGGTITANFADQWAICGIGSWSTFNGLPLKSGTVYEGTINLTAENHEFKVVNRNAGTWYTEPGKTITRAANTASATTTIGGSGNITITADKAGDYTFTFDTSDKSLTVTYPVDPTYTVTVTAGAHGSITTPVAPATTVSAGQFTPAAIVAVADDGYVFSRWTVTSGEASDVTITDATAASTTITATGAVTLTATFISTWAITGSSATFGEWSTTAFGFSNFGTNTSSKDTCYIEFDLPANTNFTFKIYNHLGTGDKWYGNSTEETYYMAYAANNDQNWEFHEGNSYKDCGLTTAGAGTYRFIWNITDEMLRVRFPESYTVTFGSSTGGTEVTASGSTSGSITTGQYVAAGENVTFTQTPATGYTFSEWNTASDGNGTQLSTETSYTFSIAANSTVYAKYNTIPYTVSIAYKCGETTLQASSTISANVAGVALVAPDIIGYSFTGWTADDGIRYGASYAGGTTTSSEASTTLYATKGADITANYAEHKAVFFKNTLGWSEVYVTYDAYWNDNGTGNDGRVYHKMTRIGKTDIYYDYIPSGYLTNSGTWKYHIAFNSEQLGNLSESDGNYNNFDKGQVIYRKDFDSNATMFVPRAEGAESYTKNGATYVCSNYTTVSSDSRYHDSYWMVYNSTASGYQLSISTSDPWATHNLTATTAGQTEFTATINLAGSTIYNFCVDKVTTYNTNSHWFANNITVTKDNCTNVELFSNPSDNCQITTTAAGDYKFTLTCGNGRLFLSVDYPLSVGDYRLVYTHDAHSKPSDIIRANPGTESIVSFYIKKWYDKSTSSGAYTDQSLKLQCCTGVNPEAWEDLTEYNTLFNNNFTLKDTSGVYNFKVSQPSPSGTPTVTYEGGYTGNFYIRTDAADGGWNAYKDFADNRLTYSEYSEKNSNYSHYFMKYVTAGKNIKFCIANDYSQCISDTLEGDTYTGNSQTLPVNANIRYTWNHETNAITRAYIGASAAIDFLRLHGNASNKLYTAATGDTYNTAVKFADDENWIYHVDVFAVPNTRIKLTANWNGHTQYFKGAATIDDFDDADDDVLNALAPYLIGGSGEKRFKMRVIYDFKTNRLTTAWLPDGENITTDTEVSADLLVIRDADSKNAPSLFTLSASGKVSLIGHIVFALEMNPVSIFDDSHTTYRNGLRSQLFQVCLPYDVNVNDIYGLPGYGTKWVIQTYSGEMRAKLSWTPYIKDFWGTVRLSDGGIIKAGTGFVISHNLQYEDFRNAGGIIDKLYLYFPSVDKDGGYTIDRPANYGTTTYDELKCNHTGRESIDSDWRLTGLPGLYPAVVADATPDDAVHGVRDGVGILYNDVTNSTTVNWLYEWGGTAGNYIVKNPKNYALNPTSAYFIQYHGSVTWTGGSYSYDDTPATPASVAAHRAPLSDYTNAQGEYIYSNEYVLTMSDEDGKLTDQAYVVVEPDATQGYTRNEDLGKSFAQNAAQIYTLSEGYQLAANTLPDTVTAVKVCLDMPSEGEYTIRLEKGGQFNHAVLEDLYTMTSTNLNTSEGYTFAAEAGRTEDRFVLRFAPQQPGTATDTETATAGTLRVTVIDGQIIVENGAKTGNTAGDMVYLYDAAGKAIYSTPFREGMTFPAPSAAGVYLVRLGSESRRIVVGK